MDSSPSEKIKQELLSWKGVTIHEHNFVGTIFYVGRIEMGYDLGNQIFKIAEKGLRFLEACNLMNDMIKQSAPSPQRQQV